MNKYLFFQMFVKGFVITQSFSVSVCVKVRNGWSGFFFSLINFGIVSGKIKFL